MITKLQCYIKYIHTLYMILTNITKTFYFRCRQVLHLTFIILIDLALYKTGNKLINNYNKYIIH